MENTMSTKCTISYSHEPEFDFHFYHECFDDEAVYLELEGPDIEFEAYKDRVMIRIPNKIWNTIREYNAKSEES